MIIGITGNYASGKDTVAKIIIKSGFKHISLSDILRTELNKQCKEVTRDSLTKFGNKLRRQNGANILAKKALERINEWDYIVTSIRTPSEAELFQTREDFILIKVTSPDEIRLNRIIERNREKDPKTIEELRKKEARENTHNKYSQQLNKVADMATKEIINDSTLEELDKRVKKLLEEII